MDFRNKTPQFREKVRDIYISKINSLAGGTDHADT